MATRRVAKAKEPEATIVRSVPGFEVTTFHAERIRQIVVAYWGNTSKYHRLVDLLIEYRRTGIKEDPQPFGLAFSVLSHVSAQYFGSLLGACDCGHYEFADWIQEFPGPTGPFTYCVNCPDMAICNECSQMSHHLVSLDNGKSYCRQCLDEVAVVCAHRGEYILKIEAVLLSNGTYLHKDYLSYAERCRGCQDLLLSSYLTFTVFRHSGFCVRCYEATRSTKVCEAPYPEFLIPAMGIEGMPDGLPGNTRVKIDVVAGEIDRETQLRIRHYVVERTGLDFLAGCFEDVGNKWQAKEGNLPKRLVKWCYENRQIKLSEVMLAEIGNIARQAAAKQQTLLLDVTRDLNAAASDFANSGSCLWGSYSYGRCLLKQNGAFAIRLFNDLDQGAGRSGNGVVARAWVMPIARAAQKARVWHFYTGTSEVEQDPRASVLWLVWNPYVPATQPQLLPARLLAQLKGQTYIHNQVIRMATDSPYKTYNNNNDYYTIIGDQELLTQLEDDAPLRLHLAVPECDCPDWKGAR